MGEPQPTGRAGRILGRVKDMYNKAKAKRQGGFTGLLTDNQITLKNLLVSAVAVGFELLLSSEVFDCPLNNHKAYGTAFLVAPFFIVFFANLVVLNELSRLTDRGCVIKYRRWGDITRCITSITKACFGPFVWLIASFTDTTYYVCSEVGQAIEKRNLTNETEIKALEEKFADAKSESHMLAWLFFAILVIVTAIVIISKRCAIKDSNLLEDPFILEGREAFAAMQTFRQCVQDLYKQDKVKEGTEKPDTNGSEGASPAAGGGEEPSPNPTATASEDESEDDKHKPEEEEKETDQLLAKHKEITLYPNGAPEQFGQKRVEKLFENWSTKNDWHYLQAYEKFAGMYPRITSGKPWHAWVSDSIAKDNVLKVVTTPPQ